MCVPRKLYMVTTQDFTSWNGIILNAAWEMSYLANKYISQAAQSNSPSVFRIPLNHSVYQNFPLKIMLRNSGLYSLSQNHARSPISAGERTQVSPALKNPDTLQRHVTRYFQGRLNILDKFFYQIQTTFSHLTEETVWWNSWKTYQNRVTPTQLSSFQSRVPSLPSKVVFIFGASNVMSTR